MDDLAERERMRAEVVVPVGTGLLDRFVIPLSPELIELYRGVWWGPRVDLPAHASYEERERALRALRPPASDAELREALPLWLKMFPDAVEVTPAFLIEWDLRGEPPEDWVNDAIDRRAQLYSPAERAFLLVYDRGSSAALLTADRYEEERQGTVTHGPT